MLAESKPDARSRVGKALLIGCGGAITLLIVFVVLVFTLTGSQVKVVEAHLAALRSKDVDGAYKYVDSKQISKGWIQGVLDLNPQVFGSSDVSFPGRKASADAGGKRVEITASIQGTDGKDYSVLFVLLEVDGEWKIAGINSEDLKGPADLAIKGVEVSQKKLDDGRTEIGIECVVVGCRTRKNGAKFDYDVVLKGKLEDAGGTALAAEQEFAHVKATEDEDGQPITGRYTYTVPPGAEEVKASIVIEDVISGKGVSQVVPVKIGK